MFCFIAKGECRVKSIAIGFLFFFSTFYFYNFSALAAPVTRQTAEQVSQNFIRHLGASRTIDTITTATFSGQDVGYIVNLSPKGYVLVAADDIRVPVKAYSLNTMFHVLPEVYRDTLLSELTIPVVATTMKRAVSASSEETTNTVYWDFLENPPATMMKMAYVPDKKLLTTTWNQGNPYNKFYPLIGNTRTLTGCTQTAIAQVMRFHEHPAIGSGVFTQSWNGQTLTAVMNRPFNWDLMPDSALAGEIHEQEEIAALMRDLAVLNEAAYGVTGTSTAFYTDRFQKAFDYDTISYMSINNSNFFDIIKSEIDNSRPVLLMLPGHLTVADGYASDGAGKKIHVNMGWEGAYDDFYVLDETIVTGSYSFDPNNSIYYNIKPCETAGCSNPYQPLGNNQAPVFVKYLEDLALHGTKKIRIDAYDPDGDTVSFSASSTCDDLQATMDQNILELTSTVSDTYCQATVTVQSGDGVASETINVLTVEEDHYLGSTVEITGQFADQDDRDEYTVYLNGQTTITADRGYTNQAAMYLWVADQSGSIVVESTDDLVSYSFAPGYYTVVASLLNRSQSSSWFYDSQFSNYILSVDTDVSIEEVADNLGIGLPRFTLEDSILSLQVITNMAPSGITLTKDVNGDGKIGLEEAIYSLKNEASED